MTKYPHVARLVFDTPWPITANAFAAVLEVIELRLDGGLISEAAVRERLALAEQAAGPRGGGQQVGQTAVIPIYGVLSHRINLMSEMSGGTSVQRLQAQFRQAIADPGVTSIVFDIDSPGGSVSGIPEFAAEVREARGQKPMVAVANTLMASAAYWIGSQADEIIASPSAHVGSIGVFMAHQDVSAAAEQMGVKMTFISAGKYKVEGNEWEPLGDDARAHFQSSVDETYAMFTADVGKARGLTGAAVRDGYGEGRVVTAREAVSMGMADRIGTLDDAVARVSNPRIRLGSRADDETPELEAIPARLSQESLRALARAIS